MRDTPFERRQHEGTAKHQNNLKRFLRDIQNNHERSERETQKAKNEVERLNRLTGSGSPQPAVASSVPSIRKSASGPFTAADQKRQWSQLSEMGIQVPDNYRAEMAMPGGWSTVSKPKQEGAADEESLSKGVRKRKLEEGEEEEGNFSQPVRKAWGKSAKSYPGQHSDDLDALLSGHVLLKREKLEAKEEKSTPSRDDAESEGSKLISSDIHTPQDESSRGLGVISEGAKAAAGEAVTESAPLVKQESTENNDGETTISWATPIPVFKKRKNKASSNNTAT